MRPPPPPPPLLWVPLLLHLGAAAAPTGSPSQLPAPRNPKIRLYNAEQVLSWEPVSLSDDRRPVTYHVQFRYAMSSQWSDVKEPRVGVNCSKITVAECNLTPTHHSQGFPRHFNVSLRVRAELPGLTSDWAMVPWFQHYRNVTIGPPTNIWVTPGEGSLIIRLSPPFDLDTSSEVNFSYYVHYWENARLQQVKGPFRSSSIVLRDLKPLRVYCLQVKAELFWELQNVYVPGLLSNTSCHETKATASTRLQQFILIAVGTLLSLAGLAGACLVLIQRYRGLIKYWFHSPPRIPVQIEEYLKDPAQPVLEALDKHSSPKDDAWDSVSIISFQEE